ncbi:long-chain-acyl-CoA synthetase [Mycolicibacterium chitae]|uniref:Fatty-acid-CoA ligase FadD6 n=1 Tax=Mycolicibacterium chitae TaxID=1792 RepID=A0A3S4RQT3_MYCCI|nr:long-chain-acyl-CoA synthetase FadD6 [Mycolicibacterium chitae]MCV7108971.1 long-chain-acyl-CoA synthetase [Mycolicibacterium chitae]BBZ03226.1 long-chain-acyl-CoA synthetase [Mycolicibacterium chitae]VEG46563.1 fatty-acid-CoA ligase FadD6 [Mycolicibacterium chitae]
MSATDARSSVGLLDIATQVPGVLMDTPSILRGVTTGLLARPTSKTSIGKVFQERAKKYADNVFIKFGDQQLTYEQANQTVNRYAAVLATRGVGHGDVVGIMLRNSPNAVLLMLATVKCGAVAGMLNYHQRGDVLEHSIGLLDAKVLVVEDDLADHVTESGVQLDSGVQVSITEFEGLAETAPTNNPASASAVLAKDPAFYIFTSGTTGHPKASVMTHQRWLRALAIFGGLGLRLTSDDTLYSCLPLYHNNALTVAVSSVLNAGATLALGEKFSASRFWDEVIASGATSFVYIGELCRYLLNQPEKSTDRAHKVRVVAGNGLRPEIWDEFTERFGIDRVCEFYSASEANTAFINIFNVPKTTGISFMPLAYVEYDADTGEPTRDENGRVRKVPAGEPGLLISPVNRLSPFDGYTDKKASEKKLIRDAFKEGDVWFNTGDVMNPQGLGHASFADRLGDTFRWKGENVATTEVEAALTADPQIEECTVFGVEVPRTGGRAGMAAVKIRDGADFDGVELAETLYDKLPVYAVPLFVRVVEELEQTTTFKSRKVDLREQGYGDDVTDPLYVLAGRREGYIPFHDEYPEQVAAGQRPKG